MSEPSLFDNSEPYISELDEIPTINPELINSKFMCISCEIKVNFDGRKRAAFCPYCGKQGTPLDQA